VAHDSHNVCGEIVVINTCGFIGDAKEESINTILEFAEAKKNHKIKHLFVMGCLTERYLDDLTAEIPEVDKFYGKFNWSNLIEDLQLIAPPTKSYDRIITTPSHHAYLKIAEGCNRFCAFCAIPLSTGRFTSRPIEEIVEEVEMLVARGVKEFNVIAQDLSSYGTDIYGEMKLAELIERLAQVPGVEWIRLHYAYPAQFPYDILPVIAKYPNVCKYLDIALQHISDNMLSAMHRHITKEQTLALLERIRREVPGINIRTTLMVGFPGETEEDFKQLLDFVRTAKFECMGAFAYCEEDDTFSAINYKDDVPPEVKQARLDAVMALQEEVALESNQQKIGSVLRVLVDREDADYYACRSQFDSPEVDPEVLVEKSKPMIVGEFYDVKIIDALPFDLIAVPV
ncbi:MAG: 30S ribosomal protein S12 methylthiotransferase RimO, partial [Muribaculaceae bacterium]|nr:30S ribosomal protein S12 methylthiotransferase RimO [Muribaculaceae bacterium]